MAIARGPTGVGTKSGVAEYLPLLFFFNADPACLITDLGDTPIAREAFRNEVRRDLIREITVATFCFAVGRLVLFVAGLPKPSGRFFALPRALPTNRFLNLDCLRFICPLIEGR